MAKSQGLVFAPRLRLKPAPAPRTQPELKSEPPLQTGLARTGRRVRSLTMAGALAPSSHTELLRLAVRRSRSALLCPCGGQAHKVRCTPGERARFGGENFARAFVCAACDTRYVGRARPLAAWSL